MLVSLFICKKKVYIYNHLHTNHTNYTNIYILVEIKNINFIFIK